MVFYLLLKEFMKRRVVCAAIISFYSVNLFAQYPGTREKFLPFIDIVLSPKTLSMPSGTHAQVTTEIVTGVDQNGREPISVTRAIREKLGISAANKISFPIKKLIVAPQFVGKRSVATLRRYSNNIIPFAPIETVRLPDQTFHEWFVRNNNIIYSVLRFVVNGTTIGGALIYSMNVPIRSALLIGMLVGSKSGLIQYNISTYEQWLENEEAARKFNVGTYPSDGLAVAAGKKIYNTVINTGEDYGKFALTETLYVAMARLAMALLDIPNLPTGFNNNAITVFKTAYHATVSQGTADLGLFKDSQIQGEYNGWSDEFQDMFRNTFAFLISVASNTFSTLELVSPGACGVVDIGFMEVPLGFAAIAVLGIGFYLHALFTYWMGP